MTTRDVIVAGAAPYPVRIGAGVVAEVADLLPAQSERIALIHPQRLGEAAAALSNAVRRTGRRVLRLTVPDAEAAKTSSVAETCWDELGAAGFTRSDAVIGLGGGATTDLAGFVAATWLRGVPVLQVPTTLAGMVDAAVGGKTGINTGAGKNLVGAFHPPLAVVADTDFLRTLPPADFTAGLAEVVKGGFIADPAILDLIEADPARARRWDNPDLVELIERKVRVKAHLVGVDLTERAGTGPSREWLNYGHTLGHAIERAEQYRWRHGDAVSVGLVFAAEVSRRVTGLPPDQVDRHRAILDSLGLPTRYQADAWPVLFDAMAVDKKARGSTIRLVLLRDVGEPVVQPAPEDDILGAAYAEVSR
jgi:3-dehydroquinate synthase